MSAQDNVTITAQQTEQQTQDKRISDVGRALILIMIGGVLLVPDAPFPEGSWLIGVGLILLGMNAARLYYGIKVNVGTVVLGVLALSAGLGEAVGIELPVLPILIVLAGVAMILNQFKR